MGTPSQDEHGEVTPDGTSRTEPRGVERHIADADKKARTGAEEEPVRNTPPAGKWNETAAD
jgi:hypothetical protein